ncbi:MAG: Asp-tRNA(Asn)/Glu-tRNA(Gln) amidotransferase subunit GatB [Planctomycetia bacterium]
MSDARGWISPSTGTPWFVVVGLEVHCQLAAPTKLFCACRPQFGAEPNTRVCAVCSAQPGALPTASKDALRLAVRAGLALSCEIAPRTRFARKHYFYCDLPKGYQISQDESPFCRGGGLTLGSGRRVRLQRIHLEEDAGKAIHDRGTDTLVDLNRAGIPLIESVTEADIASADEAVEFLEALKEILQHAGVSNCDMEKGELRCDVNISVHRAGEPWGAKVEVKNLNSFRFVHAAIEHEIARQVAALESGDPARRIVQETRLWDPDKHATRSMRRKEGAADYRYLPEPDLPEVELDAAFVEGERARLAPPPAERRARWMGEWRVAAKDAAALAATRRLADWFEAVVRAGAPGKEAASFVLNELPKALAEAGAQGGVEDLGAELESSQLLPRHVAELLRLAAAGEIGNAGARAILAALARSGGEAGALVDALGVRLVRDTAQVEAWCREALVGRDKVVADVRAGKDAAVNALLGPVLKLAGGKADASFVRETLLRLIREG